MEILLGHPEGVDRKAVRCTHFAYRVEAQAGDIKFGSCWDI